MRRRLTLPDLAAMQALGRSLAQRVRAGDVIALSGPLGSGKTTLARAILRGLGHVGEVPSPSFTLVELYDQLDPIVLHADFYRLAHPGEAAALGLDEAREGAVLIAEWPERAGGFAEDPACLSIRLESLGETALAGRLAVVEGGPAWHGRMP